MDIRILEAQCTGCELCVPACPVGALTMEDRAAQAPSHPADGLSPKVARVWESCIVCDLCLPVCPTAAIVHDRPEGAGAVPATPGSGILVIGDVGPTGLRPGARRVVRRARELAGMLGCFVSVALPVSADPGAAPRDAILCGADRVLLVDAGATDLHDARAVTALLHPLLTQEKPEIVLFANTYQARAIAPRLAERLGTGLVAGCVEVDLDLAARQLLQRVPIFKGLALGEMVTPATRPQMAILRTEQLPDPIPDGSREGEVVRWPA